MPLPPISELTDASVTEGQAKTWFTSLRSFLFDLLGADGSVSTALAQLGSIFGAGQTIRTSAYTVTTADRGRIIDCNGTFTVTLPDVAVAGAGFAVAVSNSGTGTITIDPFSSQTIDGSATKTIAQKSMVLISVANGQWFSVGGAALYPGVDSSSNTIAATAGAVKTAYDTGVNGYNTAVSAYNLAATKADSGHTHAYAPMTAIVGAALVTGGLMRFTRANGSTFDVSF